MDNLVRNRDTAHEDHKKHIAPNDLGVDSTMAVAKKNQVKRKPHNEVGDPDSIGESNMESGEMPKRGE